MTINLINQLKGIVNKNDLYLFNIDEFLRKLIKNEMKPEIEDKVFNIFYNQHTAENDIYFDKLKLELHRYYMNNDSNIENVIGRDMFKAGEYNLEVIKSIFPVLYNIWFNILIGYCKENNLSGYINSFYRGVKNICNEEGKIYTTNFDYLADNILFPQHIHGNFISNINRYSDICLCRKNDKEFYFKYIWGWNGIGKMLIINELANINNSQQFFDFDFFFQDIQINNLLIYGIGFQRSGYITKEFLLKYPKYERQELSGSVIDEHIFIRIKGLQNRGLLKTVTISYFSEYEKSYFEMLLNYYKIDNFKLINSREFNFNINNIEGE